MLRKREPHTTKTTHRGLTKNTKRTRCRCSNNKVSQNGTYFTLTSIQETKSKNNNINNKNRTKRNETKKNREIN